jgi:hypothetical protein
MTVFPELIVGSVCRLGSKPEKRDLIKTSRKLRETREGWPLQTVETEAYGDSRSTMKEVLPWLVCWACRAGRRDFWLLQSAQYKIFFFLTVHYFNSFVPIAQQAA